jgi:hypothetical protein
MQENACGGKVSHKKHGGSVAPARGNNSAQAMVPKGQAQDSVSEDISTEGRGSKRRYAKGGKVRHQVNIAIVAHPHHMMPAQGVTANGPMMQAAGPMPAGAPMAGPPGAMMPGPGQPMPMRSQGGRLPDAGAMCGQGRLEKAHEREGK